MKVVLHLCLCRISSCEHKHHPQRRVEHAVSRAQNAERFHKPPAAQQDESESNRCMMDRQYHGKHSQLRNEPITKFGKTNKP